MVIKMYEAAPRSDIVRYISEKWIMIILRWKFEMGKRNIYNELYMVRQHHSQQARYSNKSNITWASSMYEGMK